MERENHFSPIVSDKLQYYVYRLIDPRSGTTFYVGRGQGNRVFSHAAGLDKPNTREEAISLKLDIIREIETAGFEVGHVIHRHGMSEEVAMDVESALIDAYPGLANIQRGFQPQRGAMHADQVIRLYEPERARFEHRVILFKIDKSRDKYPAMPIIDAVRYQWKINKEKANKADYALAVWRGKIVGVYEPDTPWLPATDREFQNMPEPQLPGRLGFRAHEAPEKVKSLYLQKRAPLRRRGDIAAFHYEPKALWKLVDP